jgi:NAD(P)-dependent dehydrogenase (short-subunit alcohol dehydrogenase family)
LGERLLKKVVEAFLGPLRVSVMVDSNGSNTTAAAAMLSVLGQAAIGPETRVAVLGGTGPVGRRIAQLAARLGARVVLGTRDTARADRMIEHLAVKGGRIESAETVSHEQLEAVVMHCDVLFSAGPAGVEMVSQAVLERATRPRYIVDLNAVPPLGVGGAKVDDRGVERNGKRYFGAIAVGGLKMKIHRQAITKLFESNDQVLDVWEVYALGERLAASG